MNPSMLLLFAVMVLAVMPQIVASSTMIVSRIKCLREDLAKLNAEEKSLRGEKSDIYAAARARADKKLTDVERTRDDAIKARLADIETERASLEEQIENEEKRQNAERNSDRVIASVKDGWENDPKFGFRDHRDYFMAVIEAGKGKIRPNLARFGVAPGGGLRATAGSDEQSTTAQQYGGFLVPTSLLPGIETVTAEGDPLYQYTRKVQMDTPSVKINARVDKDHSTSVSGGLVVYRTAETVAATASRMAFEQVELEANDLIGLTYASNRLLQASPVAFVSLLSAGFADEFGAKLTEERLNGLGVGSFSGISLSAALLTVSKESGQAADTVVYANLAKMWSRCFRPGRAVWVVNHSVLPQLMLMTQPGSTIPVIPAMSSGVLLLFGRPVVVTERAAAIGDLGDIYLANFDEYLEGEFTPMQEASSMHVRFLENEQAFKFWKCNAGAPWWRTYMTPKRGTTISPFVTLEAR